METEFCEGIQALLHRELDHVFIIKANLAFFFPIIAMYSDSISKPIDPDCGQNEEFFIVQPCGIFSKL
jgi:hypothetical protein